MCTRCARLDTSGPIWSTRFGEPGQLAIGFSVAVDGANESYVAGCFGAAPSFAEPTAFVAKVDAEGHEVWSRLFRSPGAGSDAMAVVLDPSGVVVVLGTLLFGAVDFGGGAVHGPPPIC